MAKRKKGRRRSRRVGAIGFGGKKMTGIKLLSIAAGALLVGEQINDAIDKVLIPKNTTDPTALAEAQKKADTYGMVGEVGIGGLLLLRRKQNMLTAVGGGILAGAGLRRALKKMGAIKGYQSVPVIGRHRMTGYQSVPVIGNSGIPPQLAGKVPAQLQGYRVNGYTPAGSGMGVLAGADYGSGVTNTSGGGYMG